MKLWLLAVLIVALLPQNPGQTTQHVQQQADGSKKTSNPPPTVTKVPASPKTSDANRPDKTRTDKDEPIRVSQPIAITTRPDYAAMVFSALLVGVGAFQAYLLFRTMQAIQQQAREMAQQRIVMDGQLIQAGIQANAARDAAKAASDNIEMFINKERARLRFELLGITHPITQLPRVGFRITRHGPTEAFITAARARAEMTDSEAPPPSQGVLRLPMSIPDVIDVSMQTVDGSIFLINMLLQPSEIEGFNKGKKFIHFQGSVEYRDVFDREHQIRRRRLWKFESWNVDGTPRSGYWHYEGTGEENSDT